MCGIAGLFGYNWNQTQLAAAIGSQRHRGPDAEGIWLSSSKLAGLGHNRLSIIDLSEAGRQPMSNHDGRLQIAFNGEVYNYLELRAELSDYPYRSHSDTEVILAAYERWGERCLDRLIGMFALLIWDEREQKLFAARDRFGIKPLNYHLSADGSLAIASEIKSLFAAGVVAEPDEIAWANYLNTGLYDHSPRTFWRGVNSLPGGHCMTWQAGKLNISRWYDLAERSGEAFDQRSDAEVREEYLALLKDSIRLRFRSDVPVGINLSGGLDSSTLLGLVHAVQGADSDVKAFTFVTGDANYDELPWVNQMLARTNHPSVVCKLNVSEIPRLAESVQHHQDEPFGGLPTLAYARLFERARQEGVIVLLDGQGMDEQWAGYDYYQAAVASTAGGNVSVVQGTKDRPVKPECLRPEFSALAEEFCAPQPFADRLRNLQIRDALYTKIPRALRFNDRISMRASTELREPFLDHRLFELALRQPSERKLCNGTSKLLLRQIAAELTPQRVSEASKRPLQTPQREWLRGELRDWATAQIEIALNGWGANWLDGGAVRAKWQQYLAGESDNSFYVWQWINLGLMNQQ
jgi:asparagine synthase (glutamine-hydrolysing)